MLKELLKRVVLIVIVFFIPPVWANGLPDFTELVARQSASVVNISTSQHLLQRLPEFGQTDPFFELFKHFTPQMPREQESHSLGSGFIMSSDGYIMTNAHVVDGAEKITVRLTDKREFSAKLIGVDKRTDVALLKINADHLPQVAIGDPAKLKVGEWVVAIGSPFGFDSSVTAGIVSAKGRSLPQENFVPFIQTDVAVNPGSSGGPLFNMDGQVVGINSQIYTRSGGSMGLSFAIPIDVAMQVVSQLRSSGMVTRGRIGVTIQEVTRELAESFGLLQADGALISSVEKDGPADKAGIEAADVILKFNGNTVKNSLDLPRMVAACKPGSRATVELWRKGAIKQLSVEIARLAEAGKPVPSVQGAMSDTGKSVERLGLALSELNQTQLTELQISNGLLVEEVTGDIARAAGLQRGDVLLAIANTPLHTLKQLNGILKKIPEGRNVALLVRRGNSVSYIAIRLDDK